LCALGGVIVECGARRGLLLPDEPVELSRFEVQRYT
jgi:AMMECR1 domain-containing protein